MANTQQAEHWNGVAGRFWAERDERNDGMLAPYDLDLLDAAGIGADDDVLDVGCGCGATSRLAAATARSVLGVDLSTPMLDRAAERATDLSNVRFLRADAQVEPFGEAVFDVVVSRFGVMFFDDPGLAFANLRRALRPGGRLAFVCWRDAALNEFRSVPAAALAPYLPESARPGPFSFADPDRVRMVLDDAGFTGVRLAAVDRALPMGRDAADAAWFAARLPLTAAAVDALDAAEAAAATAALERALAPYQHPGGAVFLDSAAWLVTARR